MSIPYGLKSIPADSRNFMPVSSLTYATTGATGSAGINSLNTTTGAFAQALWARDPTVYTSGVSQGSRYTSSINGPGAGKLRDLGKTVVSSGRVFRKVQLVVPNTATLSTFGVEGATASSPNVDYLTGYIELGWEGNGQAAPVVRTM